MHQIRHYIKIFNMKECPKCLILHNNSGKFCSRKCSNSRVWSEDDNRKKSIAAKN